VDASCTKAYWDWKYANELGFNQSRCDLLRVAASMSSATEAVKRIMENEDRERRRVSPIQPKDVA
jgi:hypothetical protein